MYPAIIYQQANENHLFGDAVNSVYGIFRFGHALPPSTLWERVGVATMATLPRCLELPEADKRVEICMPCIGQGRQNCSDICENIITEHIHSGFGCD